MPVRAINFAALPTANTGMPDWMQSFSSGVQTAALPEKLRQEAQQRALANALSQIQVDYQPRMNDSTLAQQGAQTDLTGQQAKYYGPEAMSRIGLQGAQAGLAGQQAKYYGQDTLSQIALRDAQAQKMKQEMLNPFLGKIMPGIGGQVQGLEYIAQQYGRESPQYQQAQKMLELQMASTLSRNGYQNALAQSLPSRSLTPTGKSIMEQANVNAGLNPIGNQWGNNAATLAASLMNTNNLQGGPPTPIDMQQSPMMQNAQPPQNQNMPQVTAPAAAADLSGQYDLLRQKGATDTDTRKRNLFATNIEKTLDNINVNDLTQYAGAAGQAKLAKDKGLSSLGKETSSYTNYTKSLIAADMLATQVRQFYGDSVQPSMIDRLQKLTNPSTWSTNPKLASQLFNQTKNILGQEMQTYRDALKNTNVYQGQPAQSNLAQSLQQSQAPQPAAATPQYNNDQLNQWAEHAISQGADKKQVEARIKQLSGSK